MKNNLKEPLAEKIEKELVIHGDKRIDEYYWMNKRDDEKVIDYLNSENSYRDEFMKDYKGLEEELFQEIKSRIKEDDSSVPYFDNGYYYYTRYEKNKQYPIYCRKKGDLNAKEEILIDANVMSEGYDYYRVGDIEVSPDNNMMAYSVDTLSRRIYTIFFMDLKSREISKKKILNTSRCRNNFEYYCNCQINPFHKVVVLIVDMYHVVLNGKPFPPNSINELIIPKNLKKNLKILSDLNYLLIMITNQPCKKPNN